MPRVSGKGRFNDKDRRPGYRYLEIIKLGEKTHREKMHERTRDGEICYRWGRGCPILRRKR